MILYYGMLVMAAMPMLAQLFQPQLEGLIFTFFNFKMLGTIALVPFLCLMPDITLKLIQKTFFPNPSDKLLRAEKSQRFSNRKSFLLFRNLVHY
jgi:hypothetical protein